MSDAPPGTSITRDWTQFDAIDYLNEYYADIGRENLALMRFYAEIYSSLPAGGVLLDFGAGPTIYPLISAVTRVEEVHFSDYLESNLDEVRRWLAGDAAAFDWEAFIRKAIELEEGEAASAEQIQQRADEIRKRVTQVVRCDASREQAVETDRASYDVVQTNFCAESATSCREEWRSFMGNIVSLLKPGGWLVMSALKGATRYSVGPRVFPAVDISEECLFELFAELGFAEKGMEVRSVPADRPSRDYAGLMVAVAQKLPDSGHRPM